MNIKNQIERKKKFSKIKTGIMVLFSFFFFILANGVVESHHETTKVKAGGYCFSEIDHESPKGYNADLQASILSSNDEIEFTLDFGRRNMAVLDWIYDWENQENIDKLEIEMKFGSKTITRAERIGSLDPIYGYDGFEWENNSYGRGDRSRRQIWPTDIDRTVTFNYQFLGSDVYQLNDGTNINLENFAFGGIVDPDEFKITVNYHEEFTDDDQHRAKFIVDAGGTTLEVDPGGNAIPTFSKGGDFSNIQNEREARYAPGADFRTWEDMGMRHLRYTEIEKVRLFLTKGVKYESYLEDLNSDREDRIIMDLNPESNNKFLEFSSGNGLTTVLETSPRGETNWHKVSTIDEFNLEKIFTAISMPGEYFFTIEAYAANGATAKVSENFLINEVYNNISGDSVQSSLTQLGYNSRVIASYQEDKSIKFSDGKFLLGFDDRFYQFNDYSEFVSADTETNWDGNFPTSYSYTDVSYSIDVNLNNLEGDVSEDNYNKISLRMISECGEYILDFVINENLPFETFNNTSPTTSSEYNPTIEDQSGRIWAKTREITVTISDNYSGISNTVKYQVIDYDGGMGNCSSDINHYSDVNELKGSYGDNERTAEIQVTGKTGEKVVCVWAEDLTGNVTEREVKSFFGYFTSYNFGKSPMMFFDNTKPIIEAQDVYKSPFDDAPDPTDCDSLRNLFDVSAKDDYSGIDTSSYECNPSWSGTSPLNIGEYPIEFSVEDNVENKSSVTKELIVRDVENIDISLVDSDNVYETDKHYLDYKGDSSVGFEFIIAGDLKINDVDEDSINVYTDESKKTKINDSSYSLVCASNAESCEFNFSNISFINGTKNLWIEFLSGTVSGDEGSINIEDQTFEFLLLENSVNLELVHNLINEKETKVFTNDDDKINFEIDNFYSSNLIKEYTWQLSDSQDIRDDGIAKVDESLVFDLKEKLETDFDQDSIYELKFTLSDVFKNEKHLTLWVDNSLPSVDIAKESGKDFFRLENFSIDDTTYNEEDAGIGASIEKIKYSYHNEENNQTNWDLFEPKVYSEEDFIEIYPPNGLRGSYRLELKVVNHLGKEAVVNSQYYEFYNTFFAMDDNYQGQEQDNIDIDTYAFNKENKLIFSGLELKPNISNDDFEFYNEKRTNGYKFSDIGANTNINFSFNDIIDGSNINISRNDYLVVSYEYKLDLDTINYLDFGIDVSSDYDFRSPHKNSNNEIENGDEWVRVYSIIQASDNFSLRESNNTFGPSISVGDFSEQIDFELRNIQLLNTGNDLNNLSDQNLILDPDLDPPAPSIDGKYINWSNKYSVIENGTYKLNIRTARATGSGSSFITNSRNQNFDFKVTGITSVLKNVDVYRNDSGFVWDSNNINYFGIGEKVEFHLEFSDQKVLEIKDSNPYLEIKGSNPSGQNITATFKNAQDNVLIFEYEVYENMYLEEVKIELLGNIENITHDNQIVYADFAKNNIIFNITIDGTSPKVEEFLTKDINIPINSEYKYEFNVSSEGSEIETVEYQVVKEGEELKEENWKNADLNESYYYFIFDNREEGKYEINIKVENKAQNITVESMEHSLIVIIENPYIVLGKTEIIEGNHPNNQGIDNFKLQFTFTYDYAVDLIKPSDMSNIDNDTYTIVDTFNNGEVSLDGTIQINEETQEMVVVLNVSIDNKDANEGYVGFTFLEGFLEDDVGLKSEELTAQYKIYIMESDISFNLVSKNKKIEEENKVNVLSENYDIIEKVDWFWGENTSDFEHQENFKTSSNINEETLFSDHDIEDKKTTLHVRLTDKFGNITTSKKQFYNNEKIGFDLTDEIEEEKYKRGYSLGFDVFANAFYGEINSKVENVSYYISSNSFNELDVTNFVNVNLSNLQIDTLNDFDDLTGKKTIYIYIMDDFGNEKIVENDIWLYNTKPVIEGINFVNEYQNIHYIEIQTKPSNEYLNYIPQFNKGVIDLISKETNEIVSSKTFSDWDSIVSFKGSVTIRGEFYADVYVEGELGNNKSNSFENQTIKLDNVAPSDFDVTIFNDKTEFLTNLESNTKIENSEYFDTNASPTNQIGKYRITSLSNEWSKNTNFKEVLDHTNSLNCDYTGSQNWQEFNLDDAINGNLEIEFEDNENYLVCFSIFDESNVYQEDESGNYKLDGYEFVEILDPIAYEGTRFSLSNGNFRASNSVRFKRPQIKEIRNYESYVSYNALKTMSTVSLFEITSNYDIEINKEKAAIVYYDENGTLSNKFYLNNHSNVWVEKIQNLDDGIYKYLININYDENSSLVQLFQDGEDGFFKIEFEENALYNNTKIYERDDSPEPILDFDLLSFEHYLSDAEIIISNIDARISRSSIKLENLDRDLADKIGNRIIFNDGDQVEFIITATTEYFGTNPSIRIGNIEGENEFQTNVSESGEAFELTISLDFTMFPNLGEDESKYIEYTIFGHRSLANELGEETIVTNQLYLDSKGPGVSIVERINEKDEYIGKDMGARYRITIQDENLRPLNSSDLIELIDTSKVLLIDEENEILFNGYSKDDTKISFTRFSYEGGVVEIDIILENVSQILENEDNFRLRLEDGFVFDYVGNGNSRITASSELNYILLSDVPKISDLIPKEISATNVYDGAVFNSEKTIKFEFSTLNYENIDIDGLVSVSSNKVDLGQDDISCSNYTLEQNDTYSDQFIFKFSECSGNGELQLTLNEGFLSDIANNKSSQHTFNFANPIIIDNTSPQILEYNISHDNIKESVYGNENDNFINSGTLITFTFNASEQVDAERLEIFAKNNQYKFDFISEEGLEQNKFKYTYELLFEPENMLREDIDIHITNIYDFADNKTDDHIINELKFNNEELISESSYSSEVGFEIENKKYFKAGDKINFYINVNSDSTTDVENYAYVEYINGETKTNLLLSDGLIANYESGSGTNKITFTYTVEQGVNVEDLKIEAIEGGIYNVANNHIDISGLNLAKSFSPSIILDTSEIDKNDINIIVDIDSNEGINNTLVGNNGLINIKVESTDLNANLLIFNDKTHYFENADNKRVATISDFDLDKLEGNSNVYDLFFEVYDFAGNMTEKEDQVLWLDVVTFDNIDEDKNPRTVSYSDHQRYYRYRVKFEDNFEGTNIEGIEGTVRYLWSNETHSKPVEQSGNAVSLNEENNFTTTSPSEIYSGKYSLWIEVSLNIGGNIITHYSNPLDYQSNHNTHLIHNYIDEVSVGFEDTTHNIDSSEQRYESENPYIIEMENYSNQNQNASLSYNSSQVAISKITSIVNNISEELTLNEADQTVNYEIKENGSYDFEVKDSLGNIVYIRINVDKIDKETIDIRVYSQDSQLEGEYDGPWIRSSGDSNIKAKFISSFDASPHNTLMYIWDENESLKNIEGAKNLFDTIDKMNNRVVLDAHLSFSQRNNIEEFDLEFQEGLTGEIDLYAVARDESGNYSYEAIKNVTFDEEAPSLLQDEEDKYKLILSDKDSGLAEFHYEWKEIGDTPKLQVNSRRTIGLDGEKEKTIEIEKVENMLGRYILSYKIVDKAGNKTEEKNVKAPGIENIIQTYRIDTTPPEISLMSESFEVDGDIWVNNNKLTFEIYDLRNPEIADNYIKSVEYAIQNASNDNDILLANLTTFSLGGSNEDSEKVVFNISIDKENYNFEAGIEFRIKTKDNSNNISEQVFELKLDEQEPTITLAEYNKEKTNQSVEIEASIEDIGSGIEKIGVEGISNDKLDVSTENGKLNLSFKVEENGTYEIYAFDYVGNKSTKEITIDNINTVGLNFNLQRDSQINVDSFYNSNKTDYFINILNFNKAKSGIEYLSVVKAALDSEGEKEQVFEEQEIPTAIDLNESEWKFRVEENKRYIVKGIDNYGNTHYEQMYIVNIDNDSPFVDDINEAIEISGNYYLNDNKYYYNNLEDISIRINNETIFDNQKDSVEGVNSPSQSLRLQYTFKLGGESELNWNNSRSLGELKEIENNIIGNKNNIEFNLKNSYVNYDDFSGEFNYKFVDAAGNTSEIYTLDFTYHDSEPKVDVNILDSNDEPVKASGYYNEVYAQINESDNFLGSLDSLANPLDDGRVKYAVVDRFFTGGRTVSTINSSKLIESFSDERDFVDNNTEISFLEWPYDNLGGIQSLEDPFNINFGQKQLWIFVEDTLGNFYFYDSSSNIDQINIDNQNPILENYEYWIMEGQDDKRELVIYNIELANSSGEKYYSSNGNIIEVSDLMDVYLCLDATSSGQCNSESEELLIEIENINENFKIDLDSDIYLNKSYFSLIIKDKADNTIAFRDEKDDGFSITKDRSVFTSSNDKNGLSSENVEYSFGIIDPNPSGDVRAKYILFDYDNKPKKDDLEWNNFFTNSNNDCEFSQDDYCYKNYDFNNTSRGSITIEESSDIILRIGDDDGSELFKNQFFIDKDTPDVEINPKNRDFSQNSSFRNNNTIFISTWDKEIDLTANFEYILVDPLLIASEDSFDDIRNLNCETSTLSKCYKGSVGSGTDNIVKHFNSLVHENHYVINRYGDYVSAPTTGISTAGDVYYVNINGEYIEDSGRIHEAHYIKVDGEYILASENDSLGSLGDKKIIGENYYIKTGENNFIKDNIIENKGFYHYYQMSILLREKSETALMETGNYTLMIEVSDKVGNSKVYERSSITIDNDAPSFYKTLEEDTGTQVDDPSFELLENLYENVELFFRNPIRLVVNQEGDSPLYKMVIEDLENGSTSECFVDGNKDINCNRQTIQGADYGFSYDSDKKQMIYSMESGSFEISAYDLVGNKTETITIKTDPNDPIIEIGTMGEREFADSDVVLINENYDLENNNYYNRSELENIYIRITENNIGLFDIYRCEYYQESCNIETENDRPVRIFDQNNLDKLSDGNDKYSYEFRRISGTSNLTYDDVRDEYEDVYYLEGDEFKADETPGDELVNKTIYFKEYIGGHMVNLAELFDMLGSNSLENTFPQNTMTIVTYDLAGNKDVVNIKIDVYDPNIILTSEAVEIENESFDISNDDELFLEVGKHDFTLGDISEAMVDNISDGENIVTNYNTVYGSLKVTRNNTLFVRSDDLDLNSVGEYIVNLRFVDKAGNRVDNDFIVVVEDTTAPTMTNLSVEGSQFDVEQNRTWTDDGVKAIDNYELESQPSFSLSYSEDQTTNKGIVTAPKIIKYNNQEISSSSDVISSLTNLDGKREYIFHNTGQYDFVYYVEDAHGNEATFTKTINVVNTEPPQFTYKEGMETEIALTFGDVYGEHQEYAKRTFYLPKAFDHGSQKHTNVRFRGVYDRETGGSHIDGALYNIIEAYRFDGDEYIKTENSNLSALSDLAFIKMEFTQIGEYFIRFSSSDDLGNVGYSSYLVETYDDVSPNIEIEEEFLDKDNFDLSDDIYEDDGKEYDLYEWILEIGDENDGKFINPSLIAIDNYDGEITSNISRNGESPSRNSSNIVNELGVYRLIYNISDSSGNYNKVAIDVHVVDTTPPTPGEVVMNDAWTNSSRVYFEFEGGSDNSNDFEIYYQVDEIVDGEWILFESNMLPYVSLKEGQVVGEVTLHAMYKDASGNKSDVISKTAKIDTKAPIIANVEQANIYEEVEVEITDSNLFSIDVYRNGDIIDASELIVEDSDNKVVKLFSQNADYRIIAKDKAGNESRVSFTVKIIKETTVYFDREGSNSTSVEFSDHNYSKVTKDDVHDNLFGYVIPDTLNYGSDDIVRVFVRVPNKDTYYEVATFEGSSIEKGRVYNLYAGTIEIKTGDDDIESFFVDIDGDSYLYLGVTPMGEEGDTTPLAPGTQEAPESSPFTWLFISLGVIAIAFAGLQIVKARKSVKAA